MPMQHTQQNIRMGNSRDQHAKQNDEAQDTTIFLKDPITAPSDTKKVKYMSRLRARVLPRLGLCTAAECNACHSMLALEVRQPYDAVLCRCVVATPLDRTKSCTSFAQNSMQAVMATDRQLSRACHK